jgi:EAL and modified HD-GYP domain-containing signal transduction protein
MNLEEPDFKKIAEIIARDVSLSYKLMRLINSAAFGFRQKVYSIQQAVTALGMSEGRKWAALLALKGISSDSNEEIVHSSLLRAKMMEQIAAAKPEYRNIASEFFLMGLFSMIDVLLNKPMEEIVTLLPLTDRIKAVLLKQNCDSCDVIKLVLSYERGDWDEALKGMTKLKMDPDSISGYYKAAVNWVKVIDF